MDELVTKILAGDLDAASLLLLFIVGILTKRFVPWWIHEEAIQKLEEYEQQAPELLDEIGKLIGLMQKQGNAGNRISEEEEDVVRSLKPKVDRLTRQRRTPNTRRRKEVTDEFN